MFLRQRATETEYFDSPERTPDEVAFGYRELARINRLFHFAEPFQRFIPRELGNDRCRSLTLLDLGAGDGSLGRELERWAHQRGWNWRITNLDMNARALALNRGGRNVVGSATALPFKTGSFDVVIASQMTHHLRDDEEVCRHFREAWRVCGELLMLNDLHRNMGLYALLACILRFAGFTRPFREDGLLSIRRGWRVAEWRELARQAGIEEAQVSLYFGARIFLTAKRQSASKKEHPSELPHQAREAALR